MLNEVDLPTTKVISALLHKLINNTKKYNNIFIVEIIFVVTTLSPAAYNYCSYDDNTEKIISLFPSAYASQFASTLKWLARSDTCTVLKQLN